MEDLLVCSRWLTGKACKNRTTEAQPQPNEDKKVKAKVTNLPFYTKE